MVQNDVMQLLIAKDAGSGTPTTSAGSPIITASDTYLLDGEVAVCNSHNIVLSASSVLTDDLVKEHGIKVVQRSGSKIIESDLIKQENIVNYKGIVDGAAAEQITYIGYNGTANAVEVANSKLYVVRVELKELDHTGQGQEFILNAPYKSPAAATESGVANGLALSLANICNRQPVPPIKVELISNTTHAATGAFDNSVTVTNKEKLVTVGTNSQYDSGTELAVGDYVRFSATPTTTGSAVTDGIYKVVELVSGTQFNVDRPIEATSATYTNGRATATVLNSVKVAAADYGIRLTGIARAFDVVTNPYSKVEFTVGLDGSDSFGDTPITKDTLMSLGQGTYDQIAQLEWELDGNSGDVYKGDFMHKAEKAEADSTATYDQIGLVFYGDHAPGGIGATPRRHKQLLIAFATGFSNNEASDIVIDVLDAYTTQASGIGA